MLPTGRKLAALTLVGALLGAGAGASYYAYAREHLRRPSRPSMCFRKAKLTLKRLPDVSGTEEIQLADGRTVMLRADEYTAAQCAGMLNKPFGQRVAAALAEVEPEARAKAVVGLVEAVPPGQPSDAEAIGAYEIATGVVDALPYSKARSDASAELGRWRDCRFASATCPTRPPIPWVVFAFGIAGALALLPGVARGVIWFIKWDPKLPWPKKKAGGAEPAGGAAADRPRTKRRRSSASSPPARADEAEDDRAG